MGQHKSERWVTIEMTSFAVSRAPYMITYGMPYAVDMNREPDWKLFECSICLTSVRNEYGMAMRSVRIFGLISQQSVQFSMRSIFHGLQKIFVTLSHLCIYQYTVLDERIHGEYLNSKRYEDQRTSPHQFN